jgi:acyl dehydratase
MAQLDRHDGTEIMFHRRINLVEYQSLIGSELGMSSWIAIDQQRIDRFADSILDRQPIHVDPDAARHSLFGGTIAHGFLTLSLLSAMLYEAVPIIEGTSTSINYGFNSLRFLAPVRCDAHIRGRFVLRAVKQRESTAYLSTFTATVEIENEPKPALVAEWLILMSA